MLAEAPGTCITEARPRGLEGAVKKSTCKSAGAREASGAEEKRRRKPNPNTEQGTQPRKTPGIFAQRGQCAS